MATHLERYMRYTCDVARENCDGGAFRYRSYYTVCKVTQREQSIDIRR